MDKIKLVIWDLDETFWSGTLSEGGISVIRKNIEILKELTGRGIVNSIASKNEFDSVKDQLTKLDIWEYFIFPAISWQPKGQLVQEIIMNAQLRPANVLFIDDNHSNLEEVKFYNEGIHAEYPSFLDEILLHPSLKGKGDHTHQKLKDYKLLEIKHDQKKHFSSNNEFLRSSNIEVEFIEDVWPIKDRILEIIERTNQLNYTKIRIGEEGLDEQLKDPNLTNCAIKVSDRFGDYGIVGYYTINKSKHELIHFIFSCRILNLGIEQYVYSKLGFPKIQVAGDVVTELNDTHPDWINEKLEKTGSKQMGKNRLSVLLKGGCDLGQVAYYLQAYDIETIEESNYMNEGISIHNDHSLSILNAHNLTDEKKEYLIQNIPFIDERFFKTRIFDFDYEVLVFSVLMDYTQEIYHSPEQDLYVCEGGYYNLYTNPEDWNAIVNNYGKLKVSSVNHDFLTWFSKNFVHKGQIQKEEFIKNLTALRDLVPTNIPIVFLNGVECDVRQSLEMEAKDRHKCMNTALDQFLSNSVNTHLIDVRPLIGENNLTNNIRHYDRETYYKLAKLIGERIAEIAKSEIRVNKSKRFVLEKSKAIKGNIMKFFQK